MFEANTIRQWENPDSNRIALYGYLGNLSSCKELEKDHQFGRVHWFKTIFELIRDEGVEGDILEFGSWKGQGLIYLTHLRNTILSNDRKVVGIDCFKGLPISEDGWNAGSFSNASAEEVRANLSSKKKFCGDLNSIEIVEGLFSSETVSNFLNKTEKASFIYYDGDLKTSTLEALNATKKFFENQKKIFIGFDDWGCMNYTLCAAFGKFFHHMDYLTFRIIGSTNYTMFFEVTNLKYES